MLYYKEGHSNYYMDEKVKGSCILAPRRCTVQLLDPDGYAAIEANWVTAGTFAANDSVISFQTFWCICFPRTLVTMFPGLQRLGQQRSDNARNRNQAGPDPRGVARRLTQSWLLSCTTCHVLQREAPQPGHKTNLPAQSAC